MSNSNALEKLEAYAKDTDYLVFITIAPNDINSLSVFYITFRSNSNEKFLATLLDKVFNDFIDNQNILNKGEISILVFFYDKVIAVVNNLFMVANEQRRFLIGLLESLLQLLPSH